MIDFALQNGERILLEGAQGAMLDIDQGHILLSHLQ
jgi:adenylosuccinate synthase